MPADEPGSSPQDNAPSIARINALSDGVFSIAITLLVFNIKVPDLPGDAAGRELPRVLYALWPPLLSYVLSFMMIGIYWVAHHSIFHLIRCSNRLLLWANLLFLLCVAFVPFPAALLGRYPGERVAAIIYGATLIATGLSLQLLWWYASAGGRMLARPLPRGVIRQASVKILSIPVLALASIGLSFVSARLSLALYLLVPLPHILPHRLDRQWAAAPPSASMT